MVDDGSSDGSGELIKPLPLFYIQHKVNLGQGAALQTGISFALLNNAEYIVTFDADGQHAVADIERLVMPLQVDEADVVFGSRFMPGADCNISAVKKLTVNIARWINFIFTGLLLSDAHNGLRALNRKAASAITIRESRMAHASEILFEVKKHKLRFMEVPVNILYTEYSRRKGQSAFNGVKIFFDLLFNKILK